MKESTDTLAKTFDERIKELKGRMMQFKLLSARTTTDDASRNWIFSKRPLDTRQGSSTGIKEGDGEVRDEIHKRAIRGI